MSVLILDHSGAWVPMWSGDDELPQFVEVRRGDGLRESELAREDRGYADFVRLDVDVG